MEKASGFLHHGGLLFTSVLVSVIFSAPWCAIRAHKSATVWEVYTSSPLSLPRCSRLMTLPASLPAPIHLPAPLLPLCSSQEHRSSAWPVLPLADPSAFPNAATQRLPELLFPPWCGLPSPACSDSEIPLSENPTPNSRWISLLLLELTKAPLPAPVQSEKRLCGARWPDGELGAQQTCLSLQFQAVLCGNQETRVPQLAPMVYFCEVPFPKDTRDDPDRGPSASTQIHPGPAPWAPWLCPEGFGFYCLGKYTLQDLRMM